MKKNIFLFLFLFSFIINVFLIVNDGRILEQKDKKIEQLRTNKDSLTLYKNLYKEVSYFTIDENEKAQNYFEDFGYEDVMDKVHGDLTILNTQPGGNPLLPQSTDGSNTIVYKATVLNHKWIILAYKNDANDGEMLVEYTFDPNGFTTFNTLAKIGY